MFEITNWFELHNLLRASFHVLRPSFPKIGALFREYLHNKYKSSSRSKQARKLSLSKTGKHTSSTSNEEYKKGQEQTTTVPVQSSCETFSHDSSEAFFAATIRKNFASFYDVDDSNLKHYIELVDIGLSGEEGMLQHAETKDLFEKEFSLETV